MSNFSQHFMNIVYEAIAHGDNEHRAWLKIKCETLVPELDKELKKELGKQIEGRLDTEEYRNAVSGGSEAIFGTVAYDWKDKPHRLVYDLCSEVEDLRRKLKQREDK